MALPVALSTMWKVLPGHGTSPLLRQNRSLFVDDSSAGLTGAQVLELPSDDKPPISVVPGVNMGFEVDGVDSDTSSLSSSAMVGTGV